MLYTNAPVSALIDPDKIAVTSLERRDVLLLGLRADAADHPTAAGARAWHAGLAEPGAGRAGSGLASRRRQA